SADRRPSMRSLDSRYAELAGRLQDDGHDVNAVESALGSLEIELPSWGFGDSGTRFATYPQPGRPRNVFERVEDAAQVERLTGSAGLVAMHFPWDAVDDLDELSDQLRTLGLRIGAINPNLFQDPDYKLGALTNPLKGVRDKAVEHILDCISVA